MTSASDAGANDTGANGTGTGANGSSYGSSYGGGTGANGSSYGSTFGGGANSGSPGGGNVEIGSGPPPEYPDPWSKWGLDAETKVDLVNTGPMLSFTTEAANTCIQWCWLYGWLFYELQKAISSAPSLKPLSYLLSGQELAQDLDGVKTSFGTVVAAYHTVTGEMSTTFHDAAVAYADTEAQSAKALSGLLPAAGPANPADMVFDTTPVTLQTPPPVSLFNDPFVSPAVAPDAPPTFGSGQVTTPGNVPPDVPPPPSPGPGNGPITGTGTSAPVDDNPYSLSWADFHHLRVSITSALPSLLEQIEHYDGWTKRMSQLFEQPQSTLDAAFDPGGWHGKGATAAKAAVDRFISNGQALTAQVRYLGTLLTWTAQELADTAAAMPATATPLFVTSLLDPGYSTILPDLAPFQQAMIDHYLPAVQDTLPQVPTFTEPNQPSSNS